MQELIRRLSVGVCVILLFFILIGFIKDANAADYSTYKELYMLNQAGGVVALTLEECSIEKAVKKGFTSRAYATEANGSKHEGCWITPDISEAPNHPSIKIIPIVNMWFDDEVVIFPQDYFKPITPNMEGTL